MGLTNPTALELIYLENVRKTEVSGTINDRRVRHSYVSVDKSKISQSRNRVKATKLKFHIDSVMGFRLTENEQSFINVECHWQSHITQVNILRNLKRLLDKIYDIIRFCVDILLGSILYGRYIVFVEELPG